MSFKDLQIGSALDDEYEYKKGYVCRFKSHEYIKEYHFWSEGDGTSFINESEHNDYYYGDYQDNREIMFDDDFDKVVICYYMMINNSRPVFSVNRDADSDFMDEGYQSVSTWCIDIIGDEDSMPESFI